ncbi:MAG: hypothetical protein WCO21_03035 [bacterium]|nr:hypothetical protein [Candidatus Jorgensenbacteria bacterium]
MKDEKIWRILSNIWTVFFLAFLIYDFFVLDRFAYLVAPFSVIYVSILSLYAATKEFDRWYSIHDGRHPGEKFVILWTFVIFFLMFASFLSDGKYKLSPEAVASYIMNLSIFALTQKSKAMYKIACGKKE